MGFSTANVQTLLLIAVIVAMIVKKIKLPYTVGLVITGIIIAMSPYAPNITMTKGLIFNILLPPLIFEAALFLPWSELKKNFLIITLIATLGVVLAGGVVVLGLSYFIGWPLISAAIFAILISATDPVSVIATFKEIGIKGRLKILVEAESLFNDGTAAVMFAIALMIAKGKVITLPFILGQVILEIGGGIICGFIIGALAVFFTKRTTEDFIKLTYTTIAAYGSFLLAEYFHSSGILAALTAGLVFGSQYLSQPKYSKNQELIGAFWQFAAFVANSIIFLLIGLQIAHQPILALINHSLIAIVLVLLGRAVAVYPLAFLFRKSNLRITYNDQHIMFWGGLRGALGLGLVLSIPTTIPFHNEIVTLAFAVVAFSVIVQGITMPWLIKFLGLQTKK